MADPIAVTIRFSGDPDQLLERFEQLRQSWIEAQDADFEPPLFYAACKAENGIAIVTAWESAIAHRAFGQALHSHMGAAGLGMPDQIERVPIRKLGWD